MKYLICTYEKNTLLHKQWAKQEIKWQIKMPQEKYVSKQKKKKTQFSKNLWNAAEVGVRVKFML